MDYTEIIKEEYVMFVNNGVIILSTLDTSNLKGFVFDGEDNTILDVKLFEHQIQQLILTTDYFTYSANATNIFQDIFNPTKYELDYFEMIYGLPARKGLLTLLEYAKVELDLT